MADIDEAPGEVTAELNVVEVPTGAVGATQVTTGLEHGVDDHVAQCTFFDTNGTDRAGLGTKDVADLFGCRWAKRCTDGARQLEVVDAMVATHECEHDAALVVFGHDDHRLHGQARVATNKLGQLLNRRDSRRLDLGDRRRRTKVGHGCARDGEFDIGGVGAVFRQRDPILAGRRRRHVLHCLRATHHAHVRVDLVDVQAEPLEDTSVGTGLGVVGGLQTSLVAVERVGVLHDELARTQEPTLWPLLVAFLGLKLVPRLRQVSIRAHLGGSM